MIGKPELNRNIMDLQSWNTYRESFIGSYTYRLAFGTVQSGIIETNQITIPWKPSEVTVGLEKLNIPGQGTIAIDYKNAYLTEQGGMYVYCSTSGALGVNDLVRKVVDATIKITKK